MKKMDMKSWVIVGLLFFTLIFGYGSFFYSDGSKDIIKELEKEIDGLSKEREVNKKIITDLKKDLLIIEGDAMEKKVIIDSLGNEIDNLSVMVDEKKKELNKINENIRNQSKKIEEFEKSPPKREGDDLFNSLKDKLK